MKSKVIYPKLRCVKCKKSHWTARMINTAFKGQKAGPMCIICWGKVRLTSGKHYEGNHSPRTFSYQSTSLKYSRITQYRHPPKWFGQTRPKLYLGEI